MHVLALLEELHRSRAPRIIIGMRVQEELPGWVTHVLNVSEGGVTPMTRERWRGPAGVLPKTQRAEKDGSDEERAVEGELIVDLKGVGVKYGNRTVSKFSSAHFLTFFRWFSQVFFEFSFLSIFSRYLFTFRVLSFLSTSFLIFPSYSFLSRSSPPVLGELLPFRKFPSAFPSFHSLLELIQVLTMRLLVGS